MKKPLVFISYSWDSPEHKAWAKSLADRLVEEGNVEVIFDQDDCRPGDDFLYFMEQSVARADKVITILTPNYKQKVDGRIKGAGYEGTMISHEVYNQNINKLKFIPVLRAGTLQESTPILLNGRVHIDMCAEEEESFQVLLKAIHEHSDKPTPKSIPDFLKKKVEPETIPTLAASAQSRRITSANDPLLRKDAHFLGREDLIQELNLQLSDPDCFALTVIGEPGIGKTDLCKAILRKRLADDPTLQVFYLKIEDFDTTDGVRYVMAEALGYSSHLQEKELLAEVAQNPGLYYFDNLESAASDTTLPAFLEKLAETNGFQALASSREAVPGWDNTFKLNELSNEDAHQLFQKIWQEKGGSIAEDEKQPLEEFVKDSLGNHPLSITLTAAQGAFYTGMKELITEWSKIGTALAKDSRKGTDTRHRNLQVSLSLSVKTIANQKGAIQLWSLVSLFPEGMSAEDQSWFLEKNVFSREDRASLINKNILRNIEGRLTLLPPVARYAEDMLRGNKDSFLRSRFFEVAYPWFKELAENAQKAQKGAPVWKLIKNFSSIRKFMVFFAETNTHQQKLLSLHSSFFGYYGRNPFLGVDILEKLLNQYKNNIPLTAKGDFYCRIGELSGILSQYSKSRLSFEQALKYYNNPIDKIRIANVFLSLGESEMIFSNNESAKSYYNRALNLFESENQHLSAATSKSHLGYLETRTGNYLNARLLYTEALPIIEASEDDWAKATLFGNMGELETYFINYIQAREYFNTAKNLYLQIGDVLGNANVLIRLAELEIREKNTEEGKKVMHDAITLYRKISNKLGEYNAHLYTAKLTLRLEREPQEALYHLQKAGAGFEAIEGKEGIAEVGFYKAEAYHQMLQNEKALKHYREAYIISATLNTVPLNELAKETAAIIGIADKN